MMLLRCPYSRTLIPAVRILHGWPLDHQRAWRLAAHKHYPPLPSDTPSGMCGASRLLLTELWGDPR
jgi:hypothetical protein